MQNNNIIQCQQLIPDNMPFEYHGDALDLEIKPGEMISIIGPDYSGKSAWLKSICGLEDQLSGSVLINGLNTLNLSGAEWTETRMKVAYVHTDTALLSAANGLTNVMIPALYHRLDDQQPDKKQKRTLLTEKALHLLEEIDPHINLNDLPAYITKDHYFKIVIARALFLEPELLVLHKPFRHFDNDSKRLFQQFLTDRINKGISVLLVTDDIPYALNNSDRIIFTEKENLYLFNSKEEALTCNIPSINKYITLNS